jgi:DNA-binding NarL/FixJ family response regulator
MCQELWTWELISKYLGITLRTAQTWERSRGLPVHRSSHSEQTVFTTCEELDNWKSSNEHNTRDKTEEIQSWKRISDYLGIPIRTAELWEVKHGLPIHRYPGTDRSIVFALKAELDEWRRSALGEQVFARRTPPSAPLQPPANEQAAGSWADFDRDFPLAKSGLLTRILLYSDEPMLAKGFEAVLRQVEGFELLPTCSAVAGVMELVGLGIPDVVLLDLTPDVNFAVLSEMKRAMMNTKIVLWINSISTELAFQAMGVGVRGILRKTLPTDLQVKCLQKVAAGELWFEKALTDSFLCARKVALTQREGQLVSLLSQGLTNKQIATTLMISEGTVKVYLSRLFQKVGVTDRFALALFGLKNLTTGNLPVDEKGRRLGASASAMPGLRSLVLERPVAPIAPGKQGELGPPSH